MQDQTQQPTWNARSCPSWCTATHDEATGLDDRWHFSTAECVPAARLVRTFDTAGTTNRSSEFLEIEVVLERHVGEDDTWVSIGPGTERLQIMEISVESAARLHRVLGAVLRHL